MTEDESNEMYEKYLEQREEHRLSKLDRNSDLIKSFIEYCSDFGLNLSKNNFDFVETIGIVAEYKNLLSYLNPDLKMDNDNLVLCSELYDAYQKSRMIPSTLSS